MSSSSIQWSTKALAHYSNIVFDCDGVLWRGSVFLPNVVTALQELLSAKKRLFFCTNSSFHSPQDIHARFLKAGLDIPLNHVYTSSSATAAFLDILSTHSPELYDKSKDRIFVVGPKGLKSCLEARGLLFDMSEDILAGSETSLNSLAHFPLPLHKLVVTGLDRAIDYNKIGLAGRLIRENNAQFVSTNQDTCFPAEKGVILPGAGTVVAAIATAGGRRALNVGKPSCIMMDTIVEEHQLDRTSTLMVGDRIDTDVMFGNSSGMHTLLVFTGVTQPTDFHLPVHPYTEKPTPGIHTAKSPLLSNIKQEELNVKLQPNMAPLYTDASCIEAATPTYVAPCMPALIMDIPSIIFEESKQL